MINGFGVEGRAGGERDFAAGAEACLHGAGRREPRQAGPASSQDLPARGDQHLLNDGRATAAEAERLENASSDAKTGIRLAKGKQDSIFQTLKQPVSASPIAIPKFFH